MTITPFDYQKRTNIEEHNQIVDKLNEVVDAVNNIDPSGQGLEPRVSALETDVTDLGTRVDSVESKNTQQDTAIQRVEGNVSALETNVSEIGNRVATVESQNLQQDSAIATLGQRVGATEDNVTGLTGRVGQLETDTTNLDGRVTDIDGRLTTLAGNYTTLAGRVDSTDSEVGQLSTKVGNLETGKVNVAQGTENNGKYLGVGEDGNVTLKDIVIPESKTYRLSSTRATYGFVPNAPTDITINGINYKRYYGAGSLSSSLVYHDADIAKIVFNGTDAYCGSLYFMNDSSYGPNPNYKVMGDAGILYDVLPHAQNMWYTILVPADLYETINLTKIYITVSTVSLQVV